MCDRDLTLQVSAAVDRSINNNLISVVPVLPFYLRHKYFSRDVTHGGGMMNSNHQFFLEKSRARESEMDPGPVPKIGPYHTPKAT